MNYRHICTAGMVSHHDLATAHEALEAGPATHSLRQVLVRHLILELGNVADLATMSGPMYKEFPDLGELHKPIRKGLEFFKYVRNIFVGHFVPDLTDKTFEWKPETNALASKTGTETEFLVSLFALETAINTYAETETGHKVFSSETDLMYPPDYTRFLNFLGDTVIGALTYLTALIEHARTKAELPSFEKEWMQMAMKAGQADFKVLTKGRR